MNNINKQLENFDSILPTTPYATKAKGYRARRDTGVEMALQLFDCRRSELTDEMIEMGRDAATTMTMAKVVGEAS